MPDSEERHRAIVNDQTDLTCRFLPDGTLTFVNEAYCRYFQKSPGELLGKSFMNLIYEEDRGMVAKRMASTSLSSDEPVETHEQRVLTSSGEIRWQQWVNRAIFDEEGRLVEFQSVGRDITERKRAEATEVLERERGLLRTILDNMPDYIFVKDSESRFILSNKAHLNLLGLASLDAIVGKTDFDLFPHELASRYYADEQQVIRSGQLLVNREETAVGPQGREQRLLTTKAPIYDSQGKPCGIVGISRDVTERRRLEEERRKIDVRIQQAQKLESLGVLAGGIAHDFNNLLMGVLGNADLVLMELSPVSPVRGYVEEIVAASRRAAELSRQMLTYSGKGHFVVERLDVNEVIREMTRLIEAMVSKKASVRYHLAPRVPGIDADPAQIRQAILNLVTNASEAIGDKEGVITIATGMMECDSPYLSETYLDDQLPPGPYVYMEISDTGCGMDAETCSRIFDPFFTTKFVGRGLGLPAVLGVVRGHKGTIKVYSEPGRGSTFKLMFPVAVGADTRSVRGGGEKTPWRGSGIVLLVDDEPAVRGATGRMIEKAGFTPMFASNGIEAVDLFREHWKEIFCVFLDLTMPRMGGEETFRELRRIKSDVPVVLMSGYNEQDVVHRFAGKGLAGFLQKPFRFAELIGKLHGLAGAREESVS